MRTEDNPADVFVVPVPPDPAPVARRRRPDLAARSARGLPPVSRPTWVRRLDASDPGSVRLAMSVRSVVNLGVVLGAMALTAAVLGLSGTPRTVVLILGCVLAMITTFTAADPTARGRAVTTVCLPVAMLATIVLATLVDHHRILSLVIFVAVMVAVVWVRRFGPRAFACGMVAWIGYFITLFLQLSFEQLPIMLAALVVTTVVLLVLTGLLAPHRPARRLRRMIDALMARVQIARWDAARGRHRPEGTDEHTLAVAMLRTNEVAVLVDGQLAVSGAVRNSAAAPGVRAAVLRVELALAALLDVEHAYANGTEPDAGAVATASSELDEALERLRSVLDDDRAGRPVPSSVDVFTPGADLFGGFLPGSALTVGAMFDPGMRGRPVPTTVDPTPEGGRARPWWRLDGPLSLTTRQAIQIGVASAVAIVLGDVMSGQRWYWAVLACFLAFTGTATAAEASRKAGQRAIGTVIGVAIALPLLPVIGHGVTAGLITMLAALFIGFYFFRISYTVLAGAVTVLVAELYELMGSFSQQLLWLRIGETALGAVIGCVVAVCVLPTASRNAESAARAQLAEDLRDALDDVAAMIRRGRPGGPAADLHQRLRALDADIHQLAVVGVPMLRREIPGTGVPRATVRRRLASWATAAIRVRAVVHAVEDAPVGRVPGHPQVARAIAAVHALAEGSVLRSAPAEQVPNGSGPEVHRLRELAALHGALVALHEIDERAVADELGSSSDVPALPAASPPSAADWHLVGTARDRAGAPVDVVVTLVDPNGRQQGRARAAEGRYELLLPGPGTWQLVIGARGHAPRADRVIVPTLTGDGPRVVRHDVTLESADPHLVGRRGPSAAPL